jgi:integrase/recombinase XerD
LVERIPDLEREYMAYSRANKAENTCEIIQIAFWKFREFADDIPLEDVSFQLIEQFKAWRLKAVNGTTLNMNLRALKASFEFAVRLGWLLKNPFKGVKQVHVPEPDYPVYLNEDEVKELLAAIPDPEFRRLIRFYLLTGCRRTEAAKIDWHDVDLDKGTIIIRGSNTKTKRNRVLQIGDKLHDLLVEKGPQKDGRVFPRWQAGSVTVMFGRYVKACGFGRKITVHSMRHTATVHLLMAGVDLLTISRILGHASVKVTETVYTHIPAEHKRGAMDKLPF